jgi:hypothetical protein
MKFIVNEIALKSFLSTPRAIIKYTIESKINQAFRRIKAMQVKRKTMVVMVIILFTGQLIGGIRAAGKLLIPTANGEKLYNAVITIKRAEVMIECEKKIFQPFNEFDAPRQAKIKVNTAEIYKIEFNKKKNEIYLIAEDSLCQRFKHLLLPVWKVIQWMPYHEEKKEAFIFTMNNPTDIDCIEEDLIKFINERNEQSRAIKR